MNKITRLTIIFLLASAFSFSLKAQENISPNDSYDPIVANLDSLVNQSYIQKLNFAASGETGENNFKPFEIPSYSDEYYRKKMAKIQSPIPLAYNPQVREYIDLYAVRKRQLAARVMGLSSLYFPLFEQILDQNDLPLELKYLAIVESALNPTAVSRCGATGLWQFMLGTSKVYGLKVNSYIDERRDPLKATYAACQYFKNMYAIYHDWLLVIAAYNCGPLNVNKAIVRSGGKTSFWEICQYLPRETRGYVPAFIAVTYLMNNTTEHNLVSVPPVISYFDADTIYVDQKVSFQKIASAVNLPVEMVQYLNPMYKRQVIPDGSESYPLRLPVNKISAFISTCDNIFPPGLDDVQATVSNDEGNPDPIFFVSRVIKKYHTVKKKESISSVAKKYRCSASDIKRWNKLKSAKVHSGQKLLVYSTIYEKSSPPPSPAEPMQDDSVSATSKDTAMNTPAQNEDTSGAIQKVNEKSVSAKTIYHIVNPGDTLWNIAQRYEGMTVQKLKELNNIRDTQGLKPGTKLKVVVAG